MTITLQICFFLFGHKYINRYHHLFFYIYNIDILLQFKIKSKYFLIGVFGIFFLNVFNLKNIKLIFFRIFLILIC